MHKLSADLASLRIDRGAGNRHRWKRAASAGLVILALGAIGAYVIRKRAMAQEIETVRPSVQSTSGSRAPILTASGYLVARRAAVVSAKIQSRLVELDVEEGSRVKAGQVIARLESTDYEAQVEVARAQVQRAEADLAEQRRQLGLTQNLADAGVVSHDQLESALSRVRVAEAVLSQNKANLALSQANLQNTFIRAPFDGVVVKKMAEVGESVSPIPPGVNISTSSGAIVALTDLSTLEGEVDVSESNIAKLKAGQPAQLSVEAFPGRLYRARLRQVIPTADRTKATVTVKVAILNPDVNLKPEMSVKVTFLDRDKPGSSAAPASAPVIRVPKYAITTRNGAPVVFEVTGDSKVRAVPVVLGPEDQDQQVVKRGLAGSELLVAHPSDALHDGDVVRVKG
jgi:HlyD family secretion protein